MNGRVETHWIDDFLVGIDLGNAPDAAVNIELTYRVRRVRRYRYRGTAGDLEVHQIGGRVQWGEKVPRKRS
jgi:hypothetical protein